MQKSEGERKKRAARRIQHGGELMSQRKNDSLA